MPRLTYDSRTFYLDGRPFRILSGAIHYFRVPRACWRDRLEKLKACGLNTVETYACWNLHERREGQFDFTGNLDIAAYLETARALGLYVILRPGPYICAEWDWGGLPSWLLTYPGMKIRCADGLYLEKVARYYDALFSQIKPFLDPRGGSVILVQVENEYGAYGNDKAYLRALASLTGRYCGDCLLCTSDGPVDWMLAGGSLTGVLAAANFGSRPDESFDVLRRFRPDQPLLCTEFWCGWFDHWREEHHTRPAADAAQVYDRMLERGASVSFYMFHGGTNFAFHNGANCDGERYEPDVTSYDYDAPVSEAGDMTEKYFAVKAVLERRFGPAPALAVRDSAKAAYGPVALTELAPLFDNLPALTKPVRSALPLTMEEAGQDFGYILYRGTVRVGAAGGALDLGQVRDRAQVFLDGEPSLIVERGGGKDSARLDLPAGREVRVDILVENMGRANYGPALAGERKGLLSGVRVGQQYQFGWETCPLPLEDLSGLAYRPRRGAVRGPVFLRGQFTVSGTPCDTFVRTDGLTKGAVFVNGYNLGRYWNVGPTRTLYLPAPFLREGVNVLVVFESDWTEASAVTLTDRPSL